MDSDLAYIGKVVEFFEISEADFIIGVSVDCGYGGFWRGVVRKEDFCVGDRCVCFLPDAVFPKEERYLFMKKHSYRVKMRLFKGFPSEVIILPVPEELSGLPFGCDVTKELRLQKFLKPLPVCFQGFAKEPFPSFVPKTDELHYQKASFLVKELIGKPYYVSEKLDGTSTTAYKYRGRFGVCSRNFEIKKNLGCSYWQVAQRYNLEEALPEGLAIQWETCGPKVQSNPLGLKELQAFVFSAFDINKKRYLGYLDLVYLCKYLDIPMVPVVKVGESFDSKQIDFLSVGNYSLSDTPREGVVIRSIASMDNGEPISFKVMNLEYL